jgi:4-diphosphocytidyl-2-C-methyl-D-erythritol kinase
MKEKVLKIRASGKINLYLNVSKHIRSDGYHEIRSIMQSIGLSDELTFKVSDNGNIVDSTNLNGIYITSNDINIPLDEKNHVHKAAAVILDEYRLRGKYKIDINIKKNIPVCAGLAGGSSNAAATLIALNEIFGLNIRDSRLHRLAALVGSDVPFCLNGGTVLAEGRGEKLSQLPDLPFFWLVLVTDGRKLHTKDIYEMFDLVGREERSNHRELVKNIREGQYDLFFNGIENDLEKVVMTEDNKVGLFKDKAMGLGAFASQMTGSGPTVFAFCSDLVSARKVCQGLEPIADRVFLTHTSSNSMVMLDK